MEYYEAQPFMVEICRAMLEAYHPHLDGIRIAIVCREKAAKKHGKTIGADTSIPTAKLMPLFKEKYDIVICIALDVWDQLTMDQRQALIDHESCHCAVNPETGAFELRGHDLEEFAEIVARHGMWRNDGTEEAMKQALLFRRETQVDAPKLGETA